MSRVLKVQELVNVVKEYKYEVPDNISNEEFIKALEKTKGEIYEINDYLDIDFVDSEYLYDTELHCNGSETLIIKDNKVIGTIV
jgi:hypothetical protein